MARPTRTELLDKVDDGTYLDFVKGEMKEFCFTITPHEGKDRTWFGSHTVTINRNSAFNFFVRDVADDEGLEPFPVIRSETAQTVKVKVNPTPDDPSAAYDVTLFYIEAPVYLKVLESIESIASDYADLRTLPDAWFLGEPLIALLRERLLPNPAVKAERDADWPSLLK